MRWVGLVFCLLLVACGRPGEPGGPQPVTSPARTRRTAPAADVKSVARGHNGFGLALLQATAGDDNLLLSPYSTAQVLAMVYAGARGETAEVMRSALGFTLPDDRHHAACGALDEALADRSHGSSVLRLACSGWAREGKPFLPDFLDLLQRHYGAGWYATDITRESGRRAMNAWAEEQTNGLIRDLVPRRALGPATFLVLLQAAYLDAPWEHPFEGNTYDEPFHPLNGADYDVPMMSNWARLPYLRVRDAHLVELPYGGGELAMLLIVPDQGRFVEVREQLAADELAEWIGLLEVVEVDLKLPRFSFESEHGLKEPLTALGLGPIFEPADFSGIQGRSGDWVSDVLSKAVISVDEQRTTVAVAAAGLLTEGMSPPSPVEVYVDRPFLFIIHDRPTGAALFCGQVTQPIEAKRLPRRRW